jgi:PKD repeat protein
MVVRNAVCCKWLLLFIFTCSGFISRAQLTANFSATPVSGCAPLLVNFTDSSQGNPTSWKWDLGNGTISFLKNPAVTYFAPGQYTVTLTVTNASGSNQVVKTQFISVYGIPSVSFSGTPTMGCFPLPVQFTDQSQAGSGTINTLEWDFGDGNISGSQNPLHTYNGPGNFNVSLRITNSFGCTKTITKPQYIQVGTGAHAAFTNDTPSSCKSPVLVTFKNKSTGTGILNYLWDFGDGTTSTLANPTHNYLSNGAYTVRLVVTNQTGCTDALTTKNAVIVGNVSANFSNPSVICQGVPFNINNTSAPNAVTSTWDFGDGTSSTVINPNKTYNTAGNYLIKLKAGFGGCVDSIIKPISVLAKPVIAFSGDKTGACKPPLTVNFSGSAPAGISYSWDFGDGSTSTQQNPSHTYNAGGTYNVKLIVSNTAGCVDTLIKPAYIKIQAPVAGIANLPFKGCAPMAVTFTPDVTSVDPVVSYYWDFGDGGTSTLQNPLHTFTTGSYNVTLAVTTAGGCSDTITVTNAVLAGNRLKVNFSADQRDVCAFKNIQFTDLTDPVGDKWMWDFGDGTTSGDRNPKHKYNDTGYFDVKLVVWSNGCADSIVHLQLPVLSLPMIVPIQKM